MRFLSPVDSAYDEQHILHSREKGKSGADAAVHFRALAGKG